VRRKVFHPSVFRLSRTLSGNTGNYPTKKFGFLKNVVTFHLPCGGEKRGDINVVVFCETLKPFNTHIVNTILYIAKSSFAKAEVFGNCLQAIVFGEP
jgi:hypothetical protein